MLFIDTIVKKSVIVTGFSTCFFFVSGKEKDHDQAKKDDYDMVVRSMMFDRKVAPGERYRTRLDSIFE